VFQEDLTHGEDLESTHVSYTQSCAKQRLTSVALHFQMAWERNVQRSKVWCNNFS